MDSSHSMSSSSRIVREVSTVGGPGMDDAVKITRSYQVYRGMSPTTSNRMEIRIKELEDALDFEREARVRAEKNSNDMVFQFETIQERLDEAGGLSIQHLELSKKRELEIIKLRKDLDGANAQLEMNEQSLRKRYQATINELSEQVESLQRYKQKGDKEKNILLIEIDTISSQLDAALKGKAHAESKAEGYEAQLNRLKVNVDELQRQLNEFNNLKARLTQENFELQHQVQELDSTNTSLIKIKSSLQSSNDDLKRQLDDEVRQRNNLHVQLSSLQNEYDNLSARYEEESEAAGALRNQLAKLNSELQAIKSRYERELMLRTEELEELRRKLQARLVELEESNEHLRSKCSSLEKIKIKLTTEITQLSSDVDSLNALSQDLAKRLKAAEQGMAEWQRKYDEIHIEFSNLQAENRNLAAENHKFRVTVNELTDRNVNLERENRGLSEALREAKDQLRDANRQLTELSALRVQLESERDHLAKALGDAEDALRDAEARLQAAQAALSQLQIDMANRLREKDEELETIRKSSQRALDELNRQLADLESKYKSDMSRLRKKYETTIHELEVQVDNLSRNNAELNKMIKTLQIRIKEIETMYEEEKHGHENCRQELAASERKRIALITEIEDMRSLLEAAERGRKSAETELSEISSRVSELTIVIQTITNDKRRMEGDISVMQSDLDDAVNGRRSAEDRANHLASEVTRLMEELRQEQENYKNADSLRKKLEIEIREITVRLEEAEAFAMKEGKRMIAKLQSRIRDLENEFELEQRRHRDAAANARKFERLFRELTQQCEEDRRVITELQDLLEKTQLKLKQYKRQLEESEEVTAITLNKYRKAQQSLEEAEHRADLAERNVTIRHHIRHSGSHGPPSIVGNRSVSVTREYRHKSVMS